MTSKSTHLTHPKYRADIDGLRAIAVISVVLYHAFPFRFKGGFIGVDIFFVISGFLISTIIYENLGTGQFSFAEFYARRVKRIFPALLVVLTACFGIGWFTLMADDYKQLGKHIAGGAGFISNLVLWTESGYFDSAAERKPLLHLWSLGIEEQFYIVWPILLLSMKKMRINLMAVTLIALCASFFLNIQGIQSNPIGTFYSPQTRFWELLCGSLLAWLALHHTAIFSRLTAYHKNAMTLCGFVLVLMAELLITKEKAFPGWWAILPVMGAVLMIASGAQTWFNRNVLSNRFLVWFGLISFPLYLWHWPLLSFARIFENQPTALTRLLVVAVSVLLSWLTYSLIEKPIRFGQQGSTKTIVLTVLMAVAGYAGYNIYQRDGLIFRSVLGNQNTSISKYSRITDVYTFFDVKTAWRTGTCFSAPASKNLAAIVTDCVERERPLVFLWGDSYAAALYSGLKNFQKKGAYSFGIAQLTNSNAPPFFDPTRKSTDWPADNRTLLEIDNEKLGVVAELKPAVVLLAWMYNGSNGLGDKQLVVDAIRNTVSKIQSASPNSHVMVVGPVPHWNGFLKDIVIKYAQEHQGELPPVYSNFGLSNGPAVWDDFFRNEFKKSNIDYLSVLDYLCTPEGCLTRIGDDPEDLITVDWGHLTTAGSKFLFRMIGPRIIEHLH